MCLDSHARTLFDRIISPFTAPYPIITISFYSTISYQYFMLFISTEWGGNGPIVYTVLFQYIGSLHTLTYDKKWFIYIYMRVFNIIHEVRIFQYLDPFEYPYNHNMKYLLTGEHIHMVHISYNLYRISDNCSQDE